MSRLRKYLAIAVLGFLACAGAASAAEAPDGLVTRVARDVLNAVNAVRPGDRRGLISVVEEKILPYVDFQRITSLAMGRSWRDATPDQQKALTAQFRTLLIYTYVGALDRARGMTIAVTPSRFQPSDTDVLVRSRVGPPHGAATELDYRLEKTAVGWKIYDVNIAGGWLIETYKQKFAHEINRGGIDGLIRVLTAQNRTLAARMR
ncbi:MAG TPA: ABC transporter substrate-binding protein [Stellaceae bacterium]